jgi:hypothetical protein
MSEKLRREEHDEISTRLALMEDRKMIELLAQTDATGGWGKSQALDLGDHTVFCKSVPLTQREYERPFCTENLFELPTYYNYGVGSGGFGVYRELVTHIRTTHWVLSGAHENFPLMYHHRVLPRTGKRAGMSEEELKNYVRYWNDSAAVGRYVEERMQADYEVVFFLEHIPHVLGTWLPENLNRWTEVESQLLATFDFMRAQDVLHFDAHAYNLLTDGSNFYLADFGLALDLEFDLSASEMEFFHRHRYFDAAEFLGSLPRALHQLAESWTPEQKARYTEKFGDLKRQTLVAHHQEIPYGQETSWPTDYAAALTKYSELNNYMDSFFARLREASKVSDYDDEWVKSKLGNVS